MRVNLIAFIFLLITVSVIFGSCHKQSEKDSTQTNPTDSFNVNDTLLTERINPKLLEYKTFIKQLDSVDATSIPKALAKFKEVFKGQSFGLCDSGFIMYQSLYDTIEVKLNEKLQKDTTNLNPVFNNEPLSKKLKDFCQQLRINGYKLSDSEGTAYIEENRNYVAQNFYPFLSVTMKAYLSEIQTENNEGFVRNGSISISPQKHVERVIWYEKFINENPNFVYVDKCKSYNKAYLSYLMRGYKNTTLYENKQTKELSEYFINAYDYLLANYSGSQTAGLIKPYYEALKQKQTDKANQLQKSYIIKGLIMNMN